MSFSVDDWTPSQQKIAEDLKLNEGHLYSRLFVTQISSTALQQTANNVEWIRRLSNVTNIIAGVTLGVSLLTSAHSTVVGYSSPLMIHGTVNAVLSARGASSGGFGSIQLLQQLQFNSVMGKLGTNASMGIEYRVFAYSFDWSNFQVYFPMPWGDEPDQLWEPYITANRRLLLHPDGARVCGWRERENNRWLSTYFVFGVAVIGASLARGLSIAYFSVRRLPGVEIPDALAVPRWEVYILLAATLGFSTAVGEVLRNSCFQWWISVIVITGVFPGLMYVYICVFVPLRLEGFGSAVYDTFAPPVPDALSKQISEAPLTNKLRAVSLALDRLTSTGEWKIKGEHSKWFWTFAEPLLGDYNQKSGFVYATFNVYRSVAIGLLLGLVPSKPQEIAITALYFADFLLLVVFQPYRNRVRNIVEPIAALPRLLVPLAALLSAYSVIDVKLCWLLMLYGALVATGIEVVLALSGLFWFFPLFCVRSSPDDLVTIPELSQPTTVWATAYTADRTRDVGAGELDPAVAAFTAHNTRKDQERVFGLPPGSLGRSPDPIQAFPTRATLYQAEEVATAMSPTIEPLHLKDDGLSSVISDLRSQEIKLDMERRELERMLTQKRQSAITRAPYTATTLSVSPLDAPLRLTTGFSYLGMLSQPHRRTTSSPPQPEISRSAHSARDAYLSYPPETLK